MTPILTSPAEVAAPSRPALPPPPVPAVPAGGAATRPDPDRGVPAPASFAVLSGNPEPAELAAALVGVWLLAQQPAPGAPVAPPRPAGWVRPVFTGPRSWQTAGLAAVHRPAVGRAGWRRS